MRGIKKVSILSRLVLIAFMIPQLAFGQSKVETRCHRIISLAPNITETLYALELGSQLVAVTRYCKYPKESQALPRLGGLFDTNLEAGLLLSPDLVIGLPESKLVLSNFSELGIPTLMVSNQTTDEILSSFSQICGLCSCSEKANNLSQRVKEQIAPLIEERSKQGEISVALVVASTVASGSEELYISGRDGFYSSIFKLLKARNVFANNTAVIPSTSFETLISLAPNLIFIVEAGNDKFEDLKQRITTYLPKTFIIQLSGDYSVVPGPRFPMLMNDIMNAFKSYKTKVGSRDS